MNPLGLTSDQVRVLEILSRTGCVNEVARELGARREAVGMTLVRVRRRVGAPNNIKLVQAWDDFVKEGRAAT